ncbi:MAG: amidase [Dehalococcoidia bacterium]
MGSPAYELTIGEAASALRDGSLTSAALTEAVLDRIETTEPVLNAYLTVVADLAREQAATADRELQEGRDRGPLQGIPFAFKDLIDTAGIRTTGGSQYLRDRVPSDDAFVVRQLKRAGIVLTGKLGLSNYFGSTSVEPPFGVIHNPWNPSHEPGSSSGGSGAAVAAGSCLGALGTDSGGSVRTPAALCGIVGLKPTFGRVSRRGVLPLAWTLDHVGILARTVNDTALILNAIAGYDDADPSCADEHRDDYTSALGQNLRGLRVGIPRDPLWRDCDEATAGACETALVVLEQQGARLTEIELPLLSAMPEATEWSVMTAEASACYTELLRQDPDDLPAALKRGVPVSAVTYINAQRQRGLVIEETLAALREVDVFVSPTTAITAPPEMARADADRVRNRLSSLPSRYNVTGIPAMTVPCGFDAAGLPIGLSIAGRPFDEVTIFRVAYAYEQATDWHRRRPPL